ncbi:unnamed protein product [Closterium sp. NIES-64]|nr:unnamed protein product [Closterium sp. NIES-64]
MLGTSSPTQNHLKPPAACLHHHTTVSTHPAIEATAPQEALPAHDSVYLHRLSTLALAAPAVGAEISEHVGVVCNGRDMGRGQGEGQEEGTRGGARGGDKGKGKRRGQGEGQEEGTRGGTRGGDKGRDKRRGQGEGQVEGTRGGARGVKQRGKKRGQGVNVLLLRHLKNNLTAPTASPSRVSKHVGVVCSEGAKGRGKGRGKKGGKE